MKKCCETCRYFFEDGSVGVTDCTNETIEEDDIDKYYTNREEGCPYWVAKYSEKELAAEVASFENFFEASFTEDALEYAKSDVEAMIDLYQWRTKMSNRTICTYIHNSEDELKKRISCVEKLQGAIRDTKYMLSSCARALQRTFVEHVKFGIIPTIDFLTVTVTDVDDEYNWFNGLPEERILEAIADVIEWGVELELLDDDAYVSDDSELKELNDTLLYFASKIRSSYSSEVGYRKYAGQEVIRRIEAYRLMKDSADLIVRTVVASPKNLSALDLDLKVVGITANGQDKVDVSYVWHKEDEMEYSDNVETLTIDAYLLDISEVRLFIYEVQKFAERYWEERK